MGGVEEASLSGFYSKPHIHTCVYVYRTHGPARAQRGLHSSKLGTKVHPEHGSHLHNRCLPELISQSTSDNRTRSTKNPKKHKESLEFTLSVCQHRTLTCDPVTVNKVLTCRQNPCVSSCMWAEECSFHSKLVLIGGYRVYNISCWW